MPREVFRVVRSGRGGGLQLTQSQLTFMRSPYFAPNKTSLALVKGSGNQTLTRATTATVLGYAPTAVAGDSQVLLTVALNEARFKGARRISEGVWSNLLSDGTAIPETTQKGILFEPINTNRLLFSEDVSNVAWTKRGTASFVAGQVGPYGTLTGTSLTVGISATNDIFNVNAGFAASIALGTGIWLKQGTSTTGTLWVRNPSDSLRGSWVIDLSKISASNFEYVTESHPAVTILTPITSGAGGAAGIWFSNIVAANINFIFGGCSQVAGGYATSYVPTTTIAVTRNADVDNSSQTSGNIGTTGSVAFKFTPSHAPSGTIYLWGTYTDANNWVRILHDGTNLIMRKRVTGINYDATIANAFVSGATYNVSARFGTSGQQIAVNGVLGTANVDTAAAVIAATMQWGADGNSLGQPTAAIKDCYTADVAWTDAQLIGVSS